MTALLVFPPATDPAHPPLGLPSLKAYAASKGEKVRLLDLNLAAYYWLLSPNHLDECAAMLDRRIARIEALVSPTAADRVEYRRIIPDRLAAPYLQERVAPTLASFRRTETYADADAYLDAVTILRRSMSLVSAAHYPLEWAPRSLLMKYLPTKSRDVLLAVADRDANPFLAFFESQLDDIARLEPGLVGISINYYSQLIPGMTLAALLKRFFPKLPVVAGGGLIGFFCNDWAGLQSFADIVDVFVPFEGERPLLALIQSVGAGRGIGEIAGTVTFPDGRLPRYLPSTENLPADALPAPDYSDLPLDKYLSPERILPMQTSRGCYWGRCAFCSHAHLYRGRFIRKDGERVAAEMAELNRCFGARCFYFTDECIPPRTAVELAGALSESKVAFDWFGEIRLERSLDERTIARLAAGGARMLMFGLESASPRVLALMRKGIDPRTAASILWACQVHGIRAFVMLFIGFPGESAAEAEMTRNFLLAHRRFIRHIAATRFVLEYQSPVYARLGDFGVTPAPNGVEEDLKTFCDYSVHEGLSQAAARETVRCLRTHPDLAHLADQNVLSRTHLLFLPTRWASPAPRSTRKSIWKARTNPYKVRLYRREDLQAVRLPLAIDFETQKGNGAATNEADCRGHNYVFSPVLEKMLDVGEDGLKLLAFCDGRHSLGAILDAVGRGGRGTVIRFFRDLAATDALAWIEDT